MFYKIDSTKVTLHEYWWGKKNPLQTAVAGLLKVLRVQVPSSVDDPNVESMQPFQVSEEALPEAMRATFAPMMQELAGLGFHSPVFHALSDGFHVVQMYQAAFAHADGQAFARIHCRVWNKPHPPRTSLFPMFVSLFTDHTFLVSTAGKPDMHAPPACHLNRMVGADATTLWVSHQHELAQTAKPFYSVTNQEGLLWAIETYHAEVRDFHLARGVFKPMSAAEQSKETAWRQTMDATEASGLQHAEVLAELEEARKPSKAGWGRLLLILAVSMIIFVGAGASAWSWEYVLLLIPILLIHETGHYLAMRIFHYRNLRMFFIPLFGAAVSGQNYNVAGWKKVVVSLMGPVPGIGLGAMLGIIGMVLHKALLIKAGLLMLILNGFNLLPLLPLDGGWVMHAIFFSRHHLLDTGFRVVAALALVGVGALLKTKSLLYVSIATLVALPVSYKLARIANDLQRQGISPASPDDQNIPTATAQAIIGEVKKAFPKNVTNKMIAQHTLKIFETLNARPPNWAVSILFLGVHGFSVLVAVVFAAVFIVAQNSDLGKLMAGAAFMPKTPYVCGAAKVWRGEKNAASAQKFNTLTATFDKQAGAENAYESCRPRLPPEAALETFGQTVLLQLPADDEAGRKEWLAQLQLQTTNVFVDSSNFIATLSLVCIAKTQEDATNIEAELNEYFSVTTMNVVPPWLAQDRRSRAERATHRLARRTYQKLRKTGMETYKDPQVKATQRKMAQARRQGDTADLASLVQELRRIEEESRQRQISKLRQDSPDQVDVELIDLYTNLPTDNFTNQLYRELTQKMGERMGQLPLENGHLTPESEKYAAHWGGVSRNGLILTFNYVSFYRVFDGAPALADWLCNRGCVGFKYAFNGQTFYSGLDEPDE